MSTKKWKKENIEKCRSYQRKWYRKNRASEYKRIKHRVYILRRWLEEYKKKLFCIYCGEAESVCLDFHHKKGKKVRCISRLPRDGWSIRNILKEISKCEVVCANCHRKITHKKMRSRSRVGPRTLNAKIVGSSPLSSTN